MFFCKRPKKSSLDQRPITGTNDVSTACYLLFDNRSNFTGIGVSILGFYSVSHTCWSWNTIAAELATLTVRGRRRTHSAKQSARLSEFIYEPSSVNWSKPLESIIKSIQTFNLASSTQKAFLP